MNERFVTTPEDVTFVTDPETIAQIHAETGFIPLPEEEQQWISEEGRKRWALEDYVSSDELRAEYARKKALGQL
ncbi:hypothetical protein GFD17_04365 [Bifidobacterium sp. SMB2]|uniref:Uncharacterized protein n=1 Tax=Bifidobacterium saimiriisciurei TaxID=2661627 RepID=A0ABX0CJB9_9BIFI|nr:MULTISPECIES: hypothetical protein [Bifidobacterium]NEG96005.1 hypothetical protein [Bifidobacterium sp. SMB2]NEH12470.1 hypothetical protein [Bifidobacterium saimiriisciurei]